MNILLVEDEDYTRKTLGQFLRDLGHIVTEFDNGKDALRVFKSSLFHMILTDIKMPKMDGIELIQKIKSLPSGKDTDVVLFTGHGDMNTAIAALRAGAYDYLLKPVKIKELTAIVERIAEHQLLRQENYILNTKFNDAVKAATEETQKELNNLKKAYADVVGIGKIGIFSNKSQEVFNQALKYHDDRSIPVLIQGETGTGKEVIARYIHYGNIKVTSPFIAINCAALNSNVFESELFGYEAGAFTGGSPKGQKGKFDLAKGGTLFLDEITELPLELQAKLLRVIEEKEFYRVGGLKKINTDVRIICATNVNIEERVKENTFRQDLYFRFNIGRINLPPLREQSEAILPFAKMFLFKFAQKRGKQFQSISDQAAKILMSHNWSGNIREIRNVMEWVAFMHDDRELKPQHLAQVNNMDSNGSDAKNLMISPHCLPSDGFNLDEFTNNVIKKALKINNGNKSKTARFLGISRRSLYCRLNNIEKS